MALKKEKPDLLSDELVAEEEEKNWKGICIAFIVIATIVSMIITAIIFLTPDEGDSRYKHAKLTLQEIVEGKDLLDNQLFDGRWITNTELVYKTNDGNVISYNAFNNNTQILIANITMQQYQVQKYSFSPDRKYVLFVSDIKPVFHYSYTAQYKIYNVSNQQVYNLEAPGGDQLNLQYAEWGNKGSQLLFIYENNIYYLHSVGELIQQITKSGSISNGIYHGITDYLYGERILKSNKAIYWSPDGNRLCFATFDDSKVDQIQYPRYGDYRDSSNSYPKMSTLRFPKVGSFNPTVELWVVELNQPRLSSMASANRVLPPREILSGEENEYYLNTVVWIDNQRFASVWLNRYQNYSVLSLCTEKNAWFCEKHLDEHSDSLGFVDLLDPPLITADRRHYLIRLPMPNEHGTYKQIAMITINGRVKNYLTQGNCDVVKIVAHKQETHTIYYLGKSPTNSMHQHLYSIPDIHSSLPRYPTCLTCGQNQNDDPSPLEHHIQRPRHSFLSSEYLDNDPIIRQPRPNSLDDLSIFTAAATDIDNGIPLTNDENELIGKETKALKESTNLNIRRNCTFHNAIFSIFSDYYVLQCLGPDVPFAEIRTVDGNQIVLRSETNEKLEELVQRRAFPQIRNMRIQLEHNCYADVQVYLPPTLKENDHLKVPLVIEVLPADAYSNQESKDQVSTKLDFNLPIYLASNRNTVTARLQLNVKHAISNGERRPRLASSKIFSTNSLTQLLQSTVSVLKHRLPFINEDKTAMMGVGSGAYLVGQLASLRANQFNCSILVAPIVSWLFVDSFSGEKLFGNPYIEGNLVAYERADLSKKALQFKTQNLFILHGTADDEVHLQHSFALMKALNQEGVIYRSQIYPDGNHYLEDVRLHVYKSIESFLINKLKINDDIIEFHYDKAFMKMKSFKSNKE